MFNRIAHRYDLLNHLLSGGMDVLWRRRAVRLLDPREGALYLDLAAGTGDYAFSILGRCSCRVLGVDLARDMLLRMREKARRLDLESSLELLCADAEQLPLHDDSCDGLCIGFGIRNFPDMRQALAECARVLVPGGRLVILELAGIPNPLLRALFALYFRLALPLLGRLVSGDPMAYRYLPASVERFPDRVTFLAWIRDAGFGDARCIDLSLGIASIFSGIKKAPPQRGFDSSM